VTRGAEKIGRIEFVVARAAVPAPEV